MRPLIRLFFRTLRLVLTPFVLGWEKLTTPRGMERPPELQAMVDAQTRGMVLYQFRTCPFCIKVRRELKRLSLNVTFRDAQHDPVGRVELKQGGGKVQVPCLKITEEDGSTRWLYESAAIATYLQGRFAEVK